MTTVERRPAVFLDRDGTLIEDSGYLFDPAAVVLLPGSAEALQRFKALGFVRIIVTNQSGIGRGLFTELDYLAVQDEFERRLSLEGGHVEATYFCPHTPDDGCSCRKPGLKHYLDAAAAFGIDLARSWWIGDRPSDLMPAISLGGRALLVRTGQGAMHVAEAETLGAGVVPDLQGAVDRIANALVRLSD
jgi:D-glycero-D-manno-heptose 1,7-bisphosphate phosphatase